MSKIGSIRALFILASLSLLTGCIRSPLKKNIQLQPIKTEKATYEKTADDITVQAQLLSKKETKKLLGTTLKNTDLIQITVTNNTPVTYQLNKQNIDRNLLSLEGVAHQLKAKNRRPVLGIIGGVGGYLMCFLFAPVILIMGPPTAGFFCWDILKMTIPGIVGVGVTTIGVKTVHKQEEKIACDIYAALNKLSPKTLFIAPSSTESMLIFVDSLITADTLNLGLCPSGTQKVTHHFTVTL